MPKNEKANSSATEANEQEPQEEVEATGKNDSHIGNEDDEPERVELEEDVYSLMFLEDFGWVFCYAVFIVSMQLLIIALFCWDLLFRDYSSVNKFDVPIVVDINVRIAQFFALPLAVMSHEDATTALWQVGARFDHSMKEIHPNASLRGWIFTLGLRFFVGFSLIMVSFIQIVQSTRITDLFLNLEAIVLVGNIDNFAFYLADKGFLRKDFQIACAKTREISFPQATGTNRTKIRRIFLFVSYVVLVVAWVLVSRRQGDATYLYDSSCQRYDFQLGEETVVISLDDINVAGTDRDYVADERQPGEMREMLYSAFSGTYKIDKQRTTNGRPRYHEVRDRLDPDYYDDSYGIISHCEGQGNDSGAWVFTVPALSSAIGRDDTDEPCKGWLLRSPSSDAFQLSDVPLEGWRVWTGKVERTSGISYTCKDCESTVDCNYQGVCDEEEKACKCNKGTLGISCETSRPCSVLDLDLLGISAFEYSKGGKYTLLTSSFELADDNTLVSDLLLLYERPVYVDLQKNETTAGTPIFNIDKNEFEIFYYGGTRWLVAVWEAEELRALRGLIENSPPHSFWDNLAQERGFVVSSVTRNGVPASGLQWQIIRESKSRGNFGPYFSRYSIEISLRCDGSCTNVPNACGDHGECVNGLCQCKDCYGGYYCEYGPKDSYTAEFFLDIVNDGSLSASSAYKRNYLDGVDVAFCPNLGV